MLIEPDRTRRCSATCQAILNTGRLAGTGYLSILPGRPGHRALRRRQLRARAADFDPENIVKLAIEGGCNCVASTFGVLGICARKYAHKIPFIVKLNHNEFLTYPNSYDQIMFAQVKQAWDMGAVAIGATIYFGSPESTPADPGSRGGVQAGRTSSAW